MYVSVISLIICANISNTRSIPDDAHTQIDQEFVKIFAQTKRLKELRTDNVRTMSTTPTTTTTTRQICERPMIGLPQAAIVGSSASTSAAVIDISPVQNAAANHDAESNNSGKSADTTQPEPEIQPLSGDPCPAAADPTTSDDASLSQQQPELPDSV